MTNSNSELMAPERPTKVAYIIVSWNNKDILEDCIASIEKQDHKRSTIILVDNASADDSVAFVKKLFPSVVVLSEKSNHGFAKGNNIGIRKALEDPEVTHVALLNSDARLAPDWTSTLLAAAEMRPRAATLQSITLDYYDPSVIDSTHIYISHLGQATQGSFRTPLAYGYDVAPYKIFGCNAAAMMITRAFIETQPFDDFFDETMFMYLEDVDVAVRATVMGWDNFIVPGTRAFHMGSVSSKKKDPSFSLFMTFRNNSGLMFKNLPLKTLLHVIFVIPRSDRASIKHLQRLGRDKAVKALIKGRLTGLRYIPIFMLKRRKLKPYVHIDEEYLWQLMRRGF